MVYEWSVKLKQRLFLDNNYFYLSILFAGEFGNTAPVEWLLFAGERDRWL